MNPRVALAALAVATIAFSASAEARGHLHHYRHYIRMDRIPSEAVAGAFYRTTGTSRANRRHHARHRGASRRRPAFRLASYTPEGVSASPEAPARQHRGGLITVQSAAGPITIAASFRDKIVPFIADVVARGFRGGVHCFARGGHVRGSLHYSGNACDFAQTGWGRTRAPMYHVTDLTNKYGLRDGCSFRDCGHIDSGDHLGGRYYAARSHRHHHRRYASR